MCLARTLPEAIQRGRFDTLRVESSGFGRTGNIWSPSRCVEARTRSSAGQFPLPGVRCVNCGTPDSLVAVVSTRYFQFFWIPVFPFTKRCVTVCTHCKQALD
ncbi:MAG: zinc-ribbon domain-containing protein, partial [Oxalobacteraceae bacterium]